MCVIGVRSLFQLLGLAQQALKIRFGVWYLKKFHGFSLKYCVVLSTATNKVLGNWAPSANLDVNLHIQESAFPFRLKVTPQGGLLNDLWGPHPAITPPCLPQARFLYLHSSLGLFLGLCTTSGIYQHGVCWKMDDLERSEGRVRLGWKCLATSLGKARKSLNNWQEQEQAWTDL